MNYIKCFSFLLLTLIGCQSKPEHAELSVWPIAEMMKHSQTENLEEKAAEIKRIPLETSDRILIRTVNGLAEADGLWFAKHENQCSVFDSEGNYLLDIGRQGEGPNEYLKLDHFFLKEGKVYLYEAEKEIVRIFTPEGTFVRDFPTGESYNAVYPLGEDTYLGYMDNVSGNELMKIGFFTEKTLLDTIPYTQQFEHKGIYLYFANEGVVFKDGKDFYFKELFNDTIFRIEPAHTFTPRYIADLGALRPDPAARHRMTSLIANIWNEVGELTIVGVVDNKLFFNIRAKGQTASFYWDKEKEKLQPVSLKLPGENGSAPEEVRLIGVSEDGQRLLGCKNGDGEMNPEVVSIALRPGE